MLHNKKLIIFLSLLILFFIASNVHATVDYDSSHYVEITRNNGNVYRFCTREDFYLIPEIVSGTSYWSPYSVSSGENIYGSFYLNGSLYWDHEVNSQILSNQFLNGNDVVSDSSGTVILYKDDTKTDYFFQQAPILVPAVLQNRGAMTEIMSQILSILPLIIVVVVSLIGLHKGYTALLRLLRRA